MSVVGEYLTNDNARPGTVFTFGVDPYVLVDRVNTDGPHHGWRVRPLTAEGRREILYMGHRDCTIVWAPPEPEGRGFDILAREISREARERRWCSQYNDFLARVQSLLDAAGLEHLRMPPCGPITKVAIELDIDDADLGAVQRTVADALVAAGYARERVRRVAAERDEGVPF